jgi:cytochrome c553
VNGFLNITYSLKIFIISFILVCFLEFYMKKIALVLSLITLIFSITSVQAADKKAGKAKYAVCAGCHGAKGKSVNPIYPNLKGQNAKYVLSSLKAYKARKRNGGNAVQMNPFASTLSTKDMKNLAAYISSM